MNILKICVLGSSLFLMLGSCDNTQPDWVNGNVSGNWSIPKEYVKDGGPGKDGIPSLYRPEFIDAQNAEYLAEDDLVIGVVRSGQMKAYSHSVLDYHEIVNDDFGDEVLSITYCPLTGSGIGWKREISGNRTTFGVSGLLFNSNLIPYDRATDSHWSQMGLRCVEGDLRGSRPDLFKIVETTWGTWQEMYPATSVLSTNTGYRRNYSQPAYGGYKDNHQSIYYPLTNKDNRLQAKRRVLGLIAEDKTHAFPIEQFGDETKIFSKEINAAQYIIAGNSRKNFAVAYKLATNMEDSVGTFSAIQDSLPLVMRSEDGTEWDIFGRAVDGPLKGEELDVTHSFIAFWFAWAAFYPETAIHSFESD